MSGAFVNEQRLKRMTSRQAKPAWGKDYQAAIRATREEAPRNSRPTILRPRQLGWREMHLLSDPETAYALLAMHHPHVFDVHEQHLLSTEPTLHPLATHRSASNLRFKPLPGTLAVAEQLGMLAQHQKIFLEDLGESGHWVLFPYVGDLLLFLEDKQGPYCVNWTIKLRPEDFRRVTLRRVRMGGYGDIEDDLRHQLEEAYFAEAEIRTEKLALSQLDTDLILNLEEAFSWDARPYEVDESIRSHLVEGLQKIVGTNTIAFTEMKRLASEFEVPVQTVKAVFYSAIWRRHLRLDLFRPVMVDRPLRPESQDPLQRYARWFGR